MPYFTQITVKLIEHYDRLRFRSVYKEDLDQF